MARSLYFSVLVLILKTNLDISSFLAVELGKSNCPCSLNSEAVIDRILSYDPEIRDLQKLVPILLDLTDKGQDLKMTGQDARKNKGKKGSKGTVAIPYLVSQRPKRIMIGGSSEARKEEEKEKKKVA